MIARRSFLKWLGALMPIGTELTRLLTREEPATPQEAEVLRLRLNDLEQQVSYLSKLTDSQGNLDPNLFSHMSKGFSILPHDGAGFYNSVAQALVTSGNRKLIFEDDSTLTASEARYAGDWGLKRDFTNNRIEIRGKPGESLYLVICGVNWATNTANNLYAYVKETVTGDLILMDTKTGAGTGDYFNHGCIIRECVAGVEYWELWAYHDKGSNLNVNECWLQVIRIR